VYARTDSKATTMIAQYFHIDEISRSQGMRPIIDMMLHGRRRGRHDSGHIRHAGPGSRDVVAR
jgi:hypothetical protein